MADVADAVDIDQQAGEIGFVVVIDHMGLFAEDAEPVLDHNNKVLFFERPRFFCPRSENRVA